MDSALSAGELLDKALLAAQSSAKTVLLKQLEQKDVTQSLDEETLAKLLKAAHKEVDENAKVALLKACCKQHLNVCHGESAA
ncbi:hypothetical protein GNI_037500 [Gregarina niphandrodes]|uniref:Uncharacterized protein n=1 Tax=Gregarina niphandrodes TaxID=110365 RepID=A0A023BAI7_GRENI|nr:hypothetical protein GNI_037500 [Gregarina niphandrodes]EZG78352.1 hypothetical protein GNI_037500 [Gregarina niphandrodes]|eukprot:XP_011129332.1 hypothetical protein GNI_037500 [Gregarina niphandrodes]